MDENLGYGIEDDERKRSTTQWHFAQANSISLERESSKLFLQYQNYHLHLIQKKETPSKRLIIPSTKHERFSYIRNYVSTANKTQMASMHQMSFNRLFWVYIANTIFKSFSHDFVQVFLASYVPEEHLYTSKMVPFMYGTKFYFIIASVIEVIKNTNIILVFLDYLIGSVFLKSPWNRCPKDGFHLDFINVSCYNLVDFGRRVENKTVGYYEFYYYITENKEWLQLVQIEYFSDKILAPTTYYLFHASFVWGLIALCHKQIFKKTFWKILNAVHWCTVTMDVMSFVYLIFDSFMEDNYEPRKIQGAANTYVTKHENADPDFFAESLSTPPVLHVLTARSTQEILPGRDSAVLVVSNAIYFIFKALLSYQVKQRCESIAKVPIFLPSVENAALFILPMYFSTFFLGDIYTFIYLLLHFIMELLTMVVTFECTVEVVISEFSKVPRWLASLVFIAMGFISTYFLEELYPISTHTKGLAILIECIVLYWMYPIGRLVDDFTFHYGSPPGRVRTQLLCFVPFYYAVKYYNFLVVMIHIEEIFESKIYVFNLFLIVVTLMLIPIGLGIIYTVFCYIWRDRKDWRCVFTPSEDWGPRDYKVRQLRKDYDSRTFYNSQEPRELSRHIIGKAESKAYRLDILYDPSRRSTVPAPEFRTESDKK